MNLQGQDLEVLKEEVLRSLEGKSDYEKLELLRKNLNIDWDMPRCGEHRSCKTWYAQVFTYCSTSELEKELNFFLFLINLFGRIFGFCFNHESTVYLGCICPCGNKQTILYYTIAFRD